MRKLNVKIAEKTRIAKQGVGLKAPLAYNSSVMASDIEVAIDALKFE